MIINNFVTVYLQKKIVLPCILFGKWIIVLDALTAYKSDVTFNGPTLR